MSKQKQHVVTAPLAVVKQTGGLGDLYLYNGTPVPSTADSDHVKQLVELGMVGEAEVVEEKAGGAPAKSAAKGDWVAYATDEARGEDRLSEEDAEALTKDQLVEKFG